jgi:hypothetical protein
MKKVAILQSNYIPWKGYFDLIAAVDEFIIYDDMQFTKNDWRNRNQIKTPKGIEWLSIPVGQNIGRRIRDVELSNNLWQKKHWKTLCANYGRAQCFSEVAPIFEPLYLQTLHTNLSQLNREFIETICTYLGINTKISCSWDYSLADGKTERLVDLCMQVGGQEYISGPSAQNYIEEKFFSDQGITLTWFDYEGYPHYPQLWGTFTHGVTILDLLFNCGKQAPHYMKFSS